MTAQPSGKQFAKFDCNLLKSTVYSTLFSDQKISEIQCFLTTELKFGVSGSRVCAPIPGMRNRIVNISGSERSVAIAKKLVQQAIDKYEIRRF